jgi:hypothetical protein
VLGVVGAITIATTLVLTGTATPSFAAEDPTPNITVTPNTGLSDGQTVAFSVDGFGANEALTVGQCAFVGEQLACDLTGAVSVTTDESGAAAGSMTVVIRFTGSDPTGTPVGEVDCAALGEDGCFIAAANADFGRNAQRFISFG